MCHLSCTEHGSDLLVSIVDSYIAFIPCKVFITMTVIELCDTF